MCSNIVLWIFFFTFHSSIWVYSCIINYNSVALLAILCICRKILMRYSSTHFIYFESCTIPNIDCVNVANVSTHIAQCSSQSMLKLLFPLVFVTEIPSKGTASVGHKMKIHDVKRASLEDIKGRMLQCARKQELRQLIIRWLEQSFIHSVKTPWKYPRLLYSVYCIYWTDFKGSRTCVLFVYNCF